MKIKYIKIYKLFNYFFIIGILKFINCSSPSSPQDTNRPSLIVDYNITSNTVWGKGTDIIIKGEVIIDSSFCLIIENNVNIIFDSENSVLKVFGTLSSKETNETTNISFVKKETQKEDFKQNCIYAETGSLINLEYCIFDGFNIAIKSRIGSLFLRGCIFRNCYQGIYNVQLDSCIVDKCIFINNEFDITFERSFYTDVNRAIVENCEFFKSIRTSVKITNKAYGILFNNRFEDCKQGVLCEYGSNVLIKNNSILNCETGIYFYGYLDEPYGNILMNEIDNSKDGIVLYYSSPDVNYNNLLKCKDYKIKSIQFQNLVINAKYNWWDTTNEDEIKLNIFDKNDGNDSKNIGIVDFSPIMKEPINSAGVQKIAEN